MIKKKFSFVCVVPARAGSKSIKNKNLIRVNSKSLVNNTLDFASSAQIFDKIILSSDSDKILDLGSNYKNLIKHKRSKKNSKDQSTTEEVILEINNDLKLKSDYVFILEPTSYFREKSTFKKIINLINKNKPASIVSITSNKSINIDIQHNQIKTNINAVPRRRQDRDKNYMLASNFWVVRLSYFKIYKNIISKKPYFIEISKKESIDINNNFDLKLVKSFF